MINVLPLPPPPDCTNHRVSTFFVLRSHYSSLHSCELPHWVKVTASRGGVLTGWVQHEVQLEVKQEVQLEPGGSR